MKILQLFQVFGRFTKNCRAKTERLFNNVHHKCRFGLSSLLKDYETMYGRDFLSLNSFNFSQFSGIIFLWGLLFVDNILLALPNVPSI